MRSLPKNALLRLFGFALLCLATTVPASAQFGRGLRPYRAQERGAYQFGYTPTFELVVVNTSLHDLEFRLNRYKNEIQQWVEPKETWIVPAGSFGSLGVMALAAEGEFVTLRDTVVPVDVRAGQYYATFVADQETLRDYERRDPEGALLIRNADDATYNPNIRKPRYTTQTDQSQRLLRAASLLKSPRERPGKAGDYVTLKPGAFPPLRSEDVFDAGEEEPRATTDRIRQPGEELVTISMVRAGGEIPRGARFTATIGHDLAFRTESGNADGNGEIKLFTTRAENVRIDFEVAGQGAADASTFTIEPHRDTEFRVRIR